MQINCFGPLHMILAVLPFMRRRGFGRIVNVASIGGKQAVPHLLPYDASKFALVGLSTGLRTELARENILVTTANPTLMRTGSPRNAIFKSRHREEYVTNLLNPAVMATQLAPTLTTEVLAIVNRFLPGFGGIGQQARWGYGSQSAVSPSVLTALADQAAKRNNQMRPRTA
jgi:short-subunit dehydrogenase